MEPVTTEMPRSERPAPGATRPVPAGGQGQHGDLPPRGEVTVVVGIGVADRHRDTCCAQPLNRGQCAIEFGGDRDLSQRAVGGRQ